MPDEGPTLAEVLRRLDELARRIVDLTAELRQDRQEASRTFVKKETHDVQRAADDRRFKEIESDLDSQAAFRRQILAGLVLLFCSSLASIVLALTNLT